MNARTLVLTPWYFPFTSVDWRVAVTLLYLRKAEVVASYPEEIRFPSTTIKMPAVIRLRRPQSATAQGAKFSQWDLCLRHDFTCPSCEAIQPASQLTNGRAGSRTRGGRTVWTNIFVAADHNARAGACASAMDGKRSRASFQPLQLQLESPLIDPATAPDEWRDTDEPERRR